jgi:tRNA-specific 2-thiouridylase
MSRNGRVIVAMSGGVDSSVAACLLKEAGYECIGVFLRVGAAEEDAGERDGCAADGGGRRRLRHGCCSATDALDARAIAGRLGIPFYALNFRDGFDRIIEYFVDEYARARTPNPCVMCNIHLKFGRLLRYADMMDAGFVATGHYARVVRVTDGPLPAAPHVPGRVEAAHGLEAHTAALERGPRRNETGGTRVPIGGTPVPPSDRVHLVRAVNRAKDQSYVLFGIRREDLPRCQFPIGHMADKAEVRRIAAGLALRVHDKPDSQEICFVPGNDYRRLLDARRPGLHRPGELHDGAGRVVGRHSGVADYTIGQRRGLGAFGRPVYVTRLDVLSNVVTIGPREELLADGLVAERLNWLIDPPAAGEWRPAQIKIRHTHTPAAGRFRVGDGGVVEAFFDRPQPAVTPGQAAVLYDGDVVLGGGWTAEAIRLAERRRADG